MKHLMVVVIGLMLAGCTATLDLGGQNGVGYTGSVGQNGKIVDVDTHAGQPASNPAK